MLGRVAFRDFLYLSLWIFVISWISFGTIFSVVLKLPKCFNHRICCKYYLPQKPDIFSVFNNMKSDTLQPLQTL